MGRCILTFCLFLFNIGFSQQDAQFTQFSNNRLVYNPAYAGMNGLLCAGTNLRSQWVGFPGAPKTFSAWLNMKSYALRGGIGLHFTRDQLGFEKSSRMLLSYSRHIFIRRSVLGLGAGLNLQQKTLNGNWVAPESTAGDNSIPSPSAQDWLAGLDAGAFFLNEKLYAGLSTSQTTQGIFKDGSVGYKAARHYFITAGLRWEPEFLRNWDFRAHFLAKSDARSSAFDMHLQAWFGNQFYAGGGWRPGDAILVSAGTRVQGLVIGYSYDITTSSLRNHSSNTHEISIRYCIGIMRKCRIESHDNPRFMWGDRYGKLNPDCGERPNFNLDW